MKTNEQKYIDDYFKMADVNEQAVLTYITRKQPMLMSDMQDVVNRYWTNSLNSTLPIDELNIVHRKLNQYKATESYNFHGYCKLYMEHVLNHKRIKYRDAMFILLLTVMSIHHEEIKTYYKSKLVSTFRYINTFTAKECNMQATEHIVQSDVNFDYVLDLFGSSVNQTLAADAEYRVRKIIENISMSDTKPDLRKPVYKKILTQAQNFILMKASTGNYTGFLDLAARIYEAEQRINSLKQYGVEKVQFIAVVDNATTDVCLSLNGRIFRVKDLIIGRTMPPIMPPVHPCRSTVKPIIK